MKIISEKLAGTASSEIISFVPSPNKGGTMVPDSIIIHFTAGRSAESSVDWFKDPQANASAHLIIAQDGKITQLVEFNRKAWHAGASRWADRNGFNNFSIGIELDNPGRLTKVSNRYYAWFGKEYPEGSVIEARHKHDKEMSYWHIFPEKQIDTCLKICRLLMQTYNIKEILGHDDISPLRKSDPGPAFPMDSFRAKLFGRQDDTGDIYKVTTDQANIRSGAGTAFESLAKLPVNTEVEFVESRSGWFYVYVLTNPGGGEPLYGWISGALLKKV